MSFSLCQEANNEQRFLFFNRRASFSEPTLRIVQANSDQHSETLKVLQYVSIEEPPFYWRKTSLPTAKPSATTDSEQHSFVTSRLDGPLTASFTTQLLDCVYKNSLKHSFSTYVSSCLNQFLYEKYNS